jgi:hypothetical protein
MDRGVRTPDARMFQIINAMGDVMPSRRCLFAGIWRDQSVVTVRI